MRIQVSGKHMDVGDALRGHVEAHIEPAIRKYSGRPVEAAVTFSREAHEIRCECSTHLSTGLFARAQARAADAYAAFEQAVGRLEKQLRRYKRRLKDHHLRRKEPFAMDDVASYTLASAAPHEGAKGAAQAEEETEEAGLDDPPLIIAESTTRISALAVSEAVMQMEIADAPFLLFYNDAHGQLNLVYRREDGNVGWIDAARGGGNPR